MDTKTQLSILDVKVDNLTKVEVFEKTERFLCEEKFHQIATVNPEFILKAQKDEEFKNILNSCDLNVADGVGIWFAFLRFGKYLKARIAGVDLMEEIFKMANERGLGLYLVANKNGLSSWEEMRDAILKRYTSLRIEGVNLDRNSMNYKLTTNNCAIALCNFGAPYQEKFLYSLKSQENGKIKLVMGVGGSFDYFTGKVKRAPRWMRKIGLEWLFRVIQQPNRLGRIFRAVIIFPVIILLNK